MTPKTDRRTILTGLAALAAGFKTGSAEAQTKNNKADLVLFNGKFTTLDRQKPAADAIAIKDGKIAAVGSEREVMTFAGSKVQRIDLKSRRVIPGLIDSHMHIIRGGLNYNMEL